MGLLAPNSTALERALDAVAAARHALLPVDTLATLTNPETCPARFLDWLAHSRGVDTWDRGWPEDVKREVIARAIAVQRRKGTPAAIREALAAAGYEGAVIEERFGWHDHDGTHAYDGSITYAARDHWVEYRIYLPTPISIAQAAQVGAILRATAPAHSRLKLFDFTQAANLYDGAIAYDGTYSHGVV